MSSNRKQNLFHRLARRASRLAGRPATFTAAVGIILLWALLGPAAGFSDTWQLVINTSTTIVTFLMVFLIQHTQNADTEALQIKLDELIRATTAADNVLLDLEEMEEDDLEETRARYLKMADLARSKLAAKKEGRGKRPS